MNLDNIFLEKLRRGDRAAFGLLYAGCFPSIANYIRKNNGQKQDAEDIFQEAILVLLKRLEQPDSALTSSIKTYLYAISKNLWLKRLRDNRFVCTDEGVDWDRLTSQPEETESDVKGPDHVRIWMQRITANCQRVLKAIFFSNEPMEILIKKMGWKNKHTAASQKYKCIAQIKRESHKVREAVSKGHPSSMK
jgi:RNA polymerase sigma factor (sigma-70 family)